MAMPEKVLVIDLNEKPENQRQCDDDLKFLQNLIILVYNQLRCYDFIP